MFLCPSCVMVARASSNPPSLHPSLPLIAHADAFKDVETNDNTNDTNDKDTLPPPPPSLKRKKGITGARYPCMLIPLVSPCRANMIIHFYS